MRILLTNRTLASRTGTEIVIRDLSQSLIEAGHEVWVYSPILGPIAEEIRRSGAIVASQLDEISCVPEIIHGHHHEETIEAMLRFPRTPALFVIHDRLMWHDTPPLSPQVRRYVAVDKNCLERATIESSAYLH